MSKYSLVVLIFVAPLVCLTVSTILSFPRSSNISNGDTLPGDNANHRSDLEKEKKVLQELVAAMRNPVAHIEPLPNADHQAKILVEQWNAFHDRLQYIREAAQLLSIDFTSGDLAKREKELGDFAAKLERNNVALVHLRQAVDARKNIINAEIKNQEVGFANQKLFGEALSDYNARRYDACISRLSDWKGNRSAEMESLLEAARFHQRADELDLQLTGLSGSKPSKAWNGPLGRMRMFVAGSANAPRDRCGERLQELLAKLKRFEARLELASAEPPRSIDDVTDWCVLAQRCLEDEPASDFKAFASDQLFNFLQSNLKEKKTATKDLRMAIHNKDGLLEGYFDEHADSNPTKSWLKFYKGLTRKGTPEDKPSIYMAKYISEGPQETVTLRCCRQYNSDRNSIHKNRSSRDTWQKMLDACKHREEALVGYERLGGTVDITFKDEIQFLTEALKVWDYMEPILAQTQPDVAISR